MPKINLRDIYPVYENDCFVDVPQDILDEIEKSKRQEKSYLRRLRYHNVFQLLDTDRAHEAEYSAVNKPLMPHEVLENETAVAALYKAFANLPEKQAKRIYAHFFLGMSYTDIARAEGVHLSAVQASIKRGLKNMGKMTNITF